MNIRNCVVVAFGIAASAALTFAAPNEEKVARRLIEATTVLEESLARTERGIPQNLLDRSDCVGVFRLMLHVSGRYWSESERR